ncbi:MAG: hypothetical protein NZ992_00385 [Candidatus Korarchaeum sp.]|nr:hypothetical protein [Candidatus Korarchaeum sp.]MDW8035050.1 hypothetical protein [Candidatus Korarchaeum sp.]
MLLPIYTSRVKSYRRVASISSWLSLVGMLLVAATINPYRLANLQVDTHLTPTLTFGSTS